MIQRYSRWEDAMITQARLYEWSRSEVGANYLAAFFIDMNRRLGYTDGQRDPRILAAIQLRMLSHGEPVYVSGNACDLVDHARRTLPLQACLPSDPFVPEGFVLLPRPIFMTDAPPTPEAPWRAPDGQIPVRAIAWTSVHSDDMSQGSFWIAYYVDIDDELEHNPNDTRWNGVEDLARSFMPLSLMHQFQWQWGTNPANLDVDVPVDGEAEEVTKERGIEQSLLVQTLWKIGSQYVPTKERVPRQMWRQLKRKGIDRREVNVVRLRRASPDRPHDPTGRQLTVQHPVHGYWGRRHTKDGVEWRWIDGYIRGDDSLPFKDSTQRAWEFTR